MVYLKISTEDKVYLWTPRIISYLIIYDDVNVLVNSLTREMFDGTQLRR